MTMDDVFAEVRAEMEKRTKDFETKDKELKQQNDDWRKQVLGRFDQLQRGQGHSGYSPQSFRDVLAGHKGLLERPAVPANISVSIATKDILGISRLLPQTIPIVAGLGQLPLGVVDLIPQSATNTADGASVQFLREVTFTNAAASVAEGAPKPKSDKTFALVTRPCETIATYFKVSRQSWSDLPQLTTQIESNGYYAVNLELDRLLLKGTGTTPEIGPGLYTSAAAAASVAVGTSMIDRLFLAASEINSKGFLANGIVMNSSDLTAMKLLKDTQGRYIYSSSVELPRIVTSPNLAPGEFLVGDFNQAHLYVREQTTLIVAVNNEDDFVKNMITCLFETRLALATYQADGFRKNGVVAAGALEL